MTWWWPMPGLCGSYTCLSLFWCLGGLWYFWLWYFSALATEAWNWRHFFYSGFVLWLILVSSDQREEISTDTQKHAAILDNARDSVFWFLETVKVWMGGKRLTPNLSKLELLFVHQSCSVSLALFLDRVGLPLKEEIFGIFLDSGLLLEIHWHGWLSASLCYTYFVGFSLGSEYSLKCWF